VQTFDKNPFGACLNASINRLIIGFEGSVFGIYLMDKMTQAGCPGQEHKCPLDSPINDVALTEKFVAVATVDGRIYFAEYTWKNTHNKWMFND
jgi:hypothetical protein